MDEERQMTDILRSRMQENDGFLKERAIKYRNLSSLVFSL